MKKYIACISLIISSTLSAMNNNDQKPVTSGMGQKQCIDLKQTTPKILVSEKNIVDNEIKLSEHARKNINNTIEKEMRIPKTSPTTVVGMVLAKL